MRLGLGRCVLPDLSTLVKKSPLCKDGTLANQAAARRFPSALLQKVSTGDTSISSALRTTS